MISNKKIGHGNRLWAWISLEVVTAGSRRISKTTEMCNYGYTHDLSSQFTVLDKLITQSGGRLSALFEHFPSEEHLLGQKT